MRGASAHQGQARKEVDKRRGEAHSRAGFASWRQDHFDECRRSATAQRRRDQDAQSGRNGRPGSRKASWTRRSSGDSASNARYSFEYAAFNRVIFQEDCKACSRWHLLSRRCSNRLVRSKRRHLSFPHCRMIFIRSVIQYLLCVQIQ